MTHDEDDDTQVYADTLLIVYQRGYSDGKRSVQRKPLTDDEIMGAMLENGCERIEDFYAVGPVQKAAVFSFARAIEAAHNIKEQP